MVFEVDVPEKTKAVSMTIIVDGENAMQVRSFVFTPGNGEVFVFPETGNEND